MGLGTQTGKPVVDEHFYRRKKEDMMIKTNKTHKLPFEICFKILGCIFKPGGSMQDSLEERMQSGKCEQCLVERREDLQKQGCTVENKIHNHGGLRRSWTESKAGRQRS